jgi:hypothetical protein
VTPTYDQSALLSLAKRTEYETWLLEAVYAIAEQELFPDWPDGMVYPLDQKESRCFVFMRGNSVFGDWRPGFLSAGAPLIFVSSFKLLDMLIEWVIERNGGQATFRFQDKLQCLTRSPVFPSFVERHTWLKERLAGLYRTLEPLRGTIIHDKHFTSTDGSIQVSSSKRGVAGPPVQISAAQLSKLALTMVTTLNYIGGSWAFDAFRERTLRRDLDEIASLHGLPLFGQRQPYFTRVRVYQTSVDPLLVEPMVIMSDLSRQYPDQDCLFDLRVLIVRDCIVTDAFLFPWIIFAEPGADWRKGIDPAQYRTSIPADINPEHLGGKAG